MAKIHMKLGGYDSLQANTYIFSKDMGLKRDIEGYRYRDFNYLSKNQFTLVEGSTVLSMRRLSPKIPLYSAEDILAVWNDREYLYLIDDYWF